MVSAIIILENLEYSTLGVLSTISKEQSVVVGSAIPGLWAVPDLVSIHPILPPTVHIHL